MKEMTKLERAEKARDHVNYIKFKYRDEISASIDSTRTYVSSSLVRASSKDTPCTVKLVDMDSAYVLQRHTDTRNKVALLNFASFKNPGGGFLSGALSQEESLCHESTLFPVLNCFRDTYYAYNQKHIRDGMYESRMLYSPGIVFEREGLPLTKKADVITCSAVNFDVFRKKQKNAYEINKNVMGSRIKDIARVATIRGVDTLVLGAWGCGVFGQDPYVIADLMLDAIEMYPIRRVFFAIPDKKSENYQAFWDVMDSRDYPVPDKDELENPFLRNVKADLEKEKSDDTQA